MNRNKKIIWKGLLTIAMMSAPLATSVASDHDDGVTDLKEKNLNLTDLYAFREDNQTGISKHKKNLVLVMNSNPRALGGQQEHFSTKGTYEFRMTRVTAANKNAAPTGKEDIILRFSFGEPDANQRQAMTVTAIRDGVEMSAMPMDADKALLTTSLGDVTAKKYKTNWFSIDGHSMKVFAGLREDPFFFDVEQFFKVRAGAAGLGPKVAFKDAATAVDFTVGYNVNTIVLRLPMAFLQSGDKEPIFDIWETVTLK